MTAPTLAPTELAASIRRRYSDSQAPLGVYWYGGPGPDRDAYAAELRSQLPTREIGVVVVRSAGFDNPNAVGSDLAELILRNREVCEAITPSAEGRCGLVLLARTALRTPQTSSPAALPSWFPLHGDRTLPVLIEDLTWTADVAISSMETGVGEISAALFRVDGLILDRIWKVHGSDHRKTMRLLEAVNAEEKLTMSDILDQAAAFRAKVTDPSGFRPSRLADSITSRLWRIFQSCTDDGITKPAKALASALDLPEAVMSVEVV